MNTKIMVKAWAREKSMSNGEDKNRLKDGGWIINKIEKPIPHPKISQVKIVGSRNIFPISWLHTQDYCEYQIFIENIKKTREIKKRNFNQTFDLIINLKELDLKKTENKIDDNFILPKGTGKEVFVTLFSDTTKKIEGCKIVKNNEIEDLSTNKKTLKKLINETNFFLAEPKLMPIVGKFLGKYLAPRGMMPKPVTGDVNEIVEGLKKSIKIVMNKQPIIHTIVGSEKMDDKDIEENIKSLLASLEKKFPRGKHNIKNIYLKTTMGQPIKLEVI